MKTRYLIIAATIFLSRAAMAQEKGESFVGVSMSISSPLGAFKNATAGSFGHWNNSAGFAKTGFAVGVEGTRYINKHFGLAGAMYYTDHGGFSQRDASTLSASYTDAFAVDESTVSTTGRYRSLTLLVGPYFSFPLTGRWSADVRLMAGAVKSLSTPSMTVLLEDQTAATFRQRSSTALGVGWQTGAGLRYALTRKLSACIRADYFQSPGVAIQNENRSNNAGRLVTKQPLAWLNGTIGMYVRL